MRTWKGAAAAIAGCVVLGLTSAAAVAQGITITTTGGSARGFIKAVAEAFHALYRDTYPGTSATFKPSSVAGGMVAVSSGKDDERSTLDGSARPPPGL